MREQLLLDAAADDRITCDGPEVVLAPEMALHMALILHELGTNARKYGALSVPEGRLSVSWAVETTDTRLLHLEWVETGGPPVTAPGTPGFGTVLIEQSVTSHGGRTRMLSRANGISWEISLPLAKPARDALDRHLDASLSAPGQRVMARGADARADRARILVIEDEPLVAIEMASRLAEARMTVVGPVGTVDEALRLITTAQVDAALLDANLNGSTVEGIAAELTRRGVPFAFVTGYGRDSLPKPFQTRCRLGQALHGPGAGRDDPPAPRARRRGDPPDAGTHRALIPLLHAGPVPALEQGSRGMAVARSPLRDRLVEGPTPI